VCGAGIAGISTAFHLVRCGIDDVLIVDSRPPLSLTSDKSTECYRDWWPTRPMFQLMSRSIELLERYALESADAFHLGRRGYLFATAHQDRLAALARSAHTTEQMGGGELRVYLGDAGDPTYRPAARDGWEDEPSGVDLFMDGDVLRRWFPSLTEDAVGGVHIRRAGWLSAQQLGSWMLDECQAADVEPIHDEVVAVDTSGGRVRSVTLSSGKRINTDVFINAAGPLLDHVANLVGARLPVHSEMHQKIAFRDHLIGFPRDAPMLIWCDPQHLAWTDEESAALHDAGRLDLLGLLPGLCHGRPEGGEDSLWALGLWELRPEVRSPTWPLPENPIYPEVVLRGLASMLPALSGYHDRLPETLVDGGYYTKTIENMPLVGPLGPRGSFVCGALSGFGIMAACGVGELAALHVSGGPLPPYGSDFRVERYEDPAYLDSVAADTDSGQL